MKRIIAFILVLGVLMSTTVFVFAKEEPDPKVIVNPPIVIMGEEPDPK